MSPPPFEARPGHAEPDAEAVRRLFSGTVDPRTAEQLWRHLRAGCERCRRLVVRELGSGPARLPTAWEQAFGRSFQALQRRARMLARERAEAVPRAERLAELDEERQELLIRNVAAYRTWGLVERLLERVQEECFHLDRSSACRTAEAAVAVARHLDPGQYGVHPTDDLRGRAWTALANEYRIQRRYGTAQRAFRQAERHLSAASFDPRSRLRVDSLRASLLIQLGRWAEAVALVDRALARVPDDARDLRIQLLVKRGSALRHLDPAGAVDTFSEALREIPARPSSLKLSAHHGRAQALLQADRNWAAERDLLVTRGLARFRPQPSIRLMVTWLEGLVLRGMEDFDTAAQRYATARSDLQRAPDQADRLPLLALEEIDSLLGAGNRDEAVERADEVLRFLEGVGAPLLVTSTWSDVRTLAGEGSWTRERVEALGLFFWRAWHDPTVRLDRAS